MPFRKMRETLTFDISFCRRAHVVFQSKYRILKEKTIITLNFVLRCMKILVRIIIALITHCRTYMKRCLHTKKHMPIKSICFHITFFNIIGHSHCVPEINKYKRSDFIASVQPHTHTHTHHTKGKSFLVIAGSV